MPKLESVDPKWQIGPDGYSQQLQAQLSKHIEKLKKMLKLVYNGSTEEEREHWPPRNWGSKEDKEKWGLIQLLLTTLGRFAEHFKAYIGLPRLKNMKNEDEYFKCLEDTNEELGELSHQQARLLAKFVPKSNMEKTIEKIRRPLHVEHQEDGPHTHLGTYDQSSRNRYYPAEIGSPEPKSAPYISLPNSANPNRYDERHPDQSPMSKDDRVHSTPNEIQTDSVERSSEGDSIAGLDELLHQAGGGPRPYVSASGGSPYSNKPCLNYYFGSRECDGQCGYTHDEAAMQEYFSNQIMRHRQSMFGGDQRIYAELRKPFVHPTQSPSRGYDTRDSGHEHTTSF